MMRLRAPLALLLALTLALSTLAAGVARGQVSAAGGLVICTGQGVITLPAGPDGPGGPAGPTIRLCPDCVAATFAAVAIAAPAVAPPPGWRIQPYAPAPAAPAPTLRLILPRVRGPPVLA